MLFEIINPSDPYTFRTDDPVVAQAVVLLLGEGKYGLEDETGKDYPTLLFVYKEADVDELMKQNFGGNLGDWVYAHLKEVIGALDSLVVCKLRDRAEYEKALELIADPVKKKEYADFYADKHRSSLNDIGGYAGRLKERLQKRLDERTKAGA